MQPDNLLPEHKIAFFLVIIILKGLMKLIPMHYLNILNCYGILKRYFYNVSNIESNFTILILIEF